MGITTRIGLGPLVLFIAGDLSGDCHAAPIVRQLLLKNPTLAIYGIAGPAMQSAGCMPLMPFEPFNRMGFLEVFLHLPFFLRARKKLVHFIKTYRPAVVVCVDYPGFNFLILKAAVRCRIPVVWYIAPQVWAWKPKRAKILAGCASFIGVIFPFEVKYFSRYKQAAVDFVGHPLVEALNNERQAVADKNVAEEDSTSLRMAIIPGSRVQEVHVMLGPMLEAFLLLKQEFPALAARVSHCRGLSRRLYDQCFRLKDVSVSQEPLSRLLAGCTCAFVKSGTATLETALRRVPMVVVYKTSGLSYTLMKHAIRVPYIGLPNIVAGEKIVCECIQHDVTGPKLAAAMRPLLEKGETYRQAGSALARLEAQLGDKKPSWEMSARIMEYCAGKQ